MNSKVVLLSLAIVAANLVVASVAILGGLRNPALTVAVLDVFALLSIFFIHASGIRILDTSKPDATETEPSETVESVHKTGESLTASGNPSRLG